MASRAVAVAASRSAMAADSSTSTSARKTTKTMTYKTDASGNVSREVHTHVDSSSDANSASMRKMEERIHILEEDLESGTFKQMPPCGPSGPEPQIKHFVCLLVVCSNWAITMWYAAPSCMPTYPDGSLWRNHD